MMSSDLAQDLLRRGGFAIRARHRRDAARVDSQDVRLATAARWCASRPPPRHGAHHLVDHRRRPSAGEQHPRRRVQPASPGPGAGFRIRRRRHPPRGRPAPPPEPRMTGRRGHAGRRDGRGVAQLVADFGHQLPRAAPPTAAVKATNLFTDLVGRHGHRRPYCRLVAGGRAAGRLPDDLGTGRRHVAADHRRRPTAHRRADGHRLAVRRGVLRRPDRLDTARPSRASPTRT